MRGQFGDNFEDGRKYDRILFFESFHHALDHQNVLLVLRNMLKPGGKIVFSGEPIVDLDGPWANCVPFAWGPRLDGLSARAMRSLGWCELGFQKPYFIELLMRSGYSVGFQPSDGRGTCYVATPLEGGQLHVGKADLIEVHEGTDAGWYAPEGAYRWTKARAILPTPVGVRLARVEVSNPLPFEKSVRLYSQAGKVETAMAAETSATLEIGLLMEGDRLIIETNTHRLSEIFPNLIDDRDLGVQISTVIYTGESHCND